MTNDHPGLRRFLADVLEDEKYPDEPGICPNCSGSGEGQYEGTRCSSCKGSGESIGGCDDFDEPEEDEDDSQ